MRKLLGGSQPWLLSTVGAVMIVFVLLSLFKVPKVPPLTEKPVDSSAPVAKVELARNGDALLKEEASLRDPTPLFLPTHWNAGEDALAVNAPREPGGVLQDYAPKPTYAEAELRLELPPLVKLPANTADVFRFDKVERPFAGFGRTEGAPPVLPSRGGFIQVVGAGNGDILLNQPLTGERPPGEASWQPLEFLVAIDTAGIVRPPILTESSRVVAVDNYFQEYLLSVLHVGERFPPGFYRISIGP